MILDLKRNPTWAEVERAAGNSEIIKRIRYWRIKSEIALNERLCNVAVDIIAKVRSEIDAEGSPSNASKVAVDNAEDLRYKLISEREELRVLLELYDADKT